MYVYFAFTSLVIVVELCTLLCYQVIVLKLDKEFQSSFKFCPPFCLSELKVGAVNHFQFHRFALNFTFLHSVSLLCSQVHFFALKLTICTDLALTEMFLNNQNAEIVASIL